METPLTKEAKMAFMTFRGLGKRIIDDLIVEVERLSEPSAARIDAAARALYELNPYEEGPEYIDGMPIKGRTKPHIYSWDELLELAEPVQDEYREMAKAALTAAQP